MTSIFYNINVFTLIKLVALTKHESISNESIFIYYIVLKYIRPLELLNLAFITFDYWIVSIPVGVVVKSVVKNAESPIK